MKYVVIARLKKPEPEKEAEIIPVFYPVIFPDHVCHCEMVPPGFQAVSAGDIFQNRDGTWTCSGNSTTLGLASLGDKDSVFVSSYMRYGESVLMIVSGAYHNNIRRRAYQKAAKKVNGNGISHSKALGAHTQ